MTYDSLRQRVVLFGGARLSDTWEWDGTTWLQRSPATSPPGRDSHSLTFDVSRGRVVLFGGSGNTGRLADTWEWDGVSWIQRLSTRSPASRAWPAFAYDPATERSILFTGWTSSTSNLIASTRAFHAMLAAED